MGRMNTITHHARVQKAIQQLVVQEKVKRIHVLKADFNLKPTNVTPLRRLST